MTLAEALAMPPGRELDAVVAVRCCGWRWYQGCDGLFVLMLPQRSLLFNQNELYLEPPDWCSAANGSGAEPFSTDLTAAFLLVQAAIGAGSVPINLWWDHDRWCCVLGGSNVLSSAPTLPHAIVRAALRWKWREET